MRCGNLHFCKKMKTKVLGSGSCRTIKLVFRPRMSWTLLYDQGLSVSGVQTLILNGLRITFQKV